MGLRTYMRLELPRLVARTTTSIVQAAKDSRNIIMDQLLYDTKTFGPS